MSKFFLGIGSLALLIFLIVWLWQRQPSGPSQTVLSQQTKAKDAQIQPAADSVAKPLDNLVVATEKIKIRGKLSPNDYLVITSNLFNKIVKTEIDGSFEVELTLQKDLNLIDYISLSSDLKKINVYPLTFFFSPDKKFKSVQAGSVKSIFDTLLTLTTPNGEINVRTSAATELAIPKLEEDETAESTGAALRSIRVGDYAISLGENSDSNSQNSQSLTIIRQNKPQNNQKTVTAQIATAPKQNAFLAKNLSDSKAFDLVITKETEIQLETAIPGAADPTPKAPPTTQSLSSQIVKDKNAIIIYHEENGKNIADLIYLLP